MNSVSRILVALSGLVLLASPAAADNVRIVDGDTIEVDGTPFRIFGIDAPEGGQRCQDASGGTWRCGDEAVDMLADLTNDNDVTCKGKELDEYGRTLAICYAGDIDLGAAMVEAGLAWSFRRYADVYNDLEDQARASGIGIWQAETQTPWDLRAERWAVGVQEAPEGCPIKGNIASDGERIYHAPWSPWYTRTKIAVENGERWFCDEGEALEAGWRAPLWGG
jgi:endonuclease YncB( thermonuclease family)